jgi:hypothetical protein
VSRLSIPGSIPSSNPFNTAILKDGRLDSSPHSSLLMPHQRIDEIPLNRYNPPNHSSGAGRSCRH